MQILNKLIIKLHRSAFFGRIFHTLDYCLKVELDGCSSVLDLGCGPDSPTSRNGKFSELVGVDGFEPYAKKAISSGRYTQVLVKNLNDCTFDPDSFDAVVLTEVIEHLPKEDALKLLNNAKTWARRKVIISTPNGFLEQPVLDENLFQRHQSGWLPVDFKNLGFRVHGLAGLKLLRVPKDTDDSMGDDLAVSLKYRPKFLWFIIAALTQVLTYYIPDLAFEFFAVYNK